MKTRYQSLDLVVVETVGDVLEGFGLLPELCQLHCLAGDVDALVAAAPSEGVLLNGTGNDNVVDVFQRL